MAKKTFEQILTDLQKRSFDPLYFLVGEEPYFIDVIADYIANHALDEADKEFNQTILYGKDTDIGTVISAAQRFPMMAEKQVVIVREAQETKNIEKLVQVKINGKNQEVNLLEEYSKNMLPSTILVFCYKYKKLDGRKSLGKTLQKHATYFASDKLYDNKVPAWIEGYCKQKKISINPRAVQLLAEYLGSDLSRIANDLDKLLINKKDTAEISVEDVQKNIGISKDYNVFELQDAITKKDILKANRIVNYFAANEKENPMVMVLGVLYSFFSKVIQYHASPDKSPQAIASLLKVNPYFTKDYELAARNFNPAKLTRIISYLREYDLKVKGRNTGDTDKTEFYKELIFKMLH